MQHKIKEHRLVQELDLMRYYSFCNIIVVLNGAYYNRHQTNDVITLTFMQQISHMYTAEVAYFMSNLDLFSNSVGTNVLYTLEWR